jgi:hypothetical protein
MDSFFVIYMAAWIACCVAAAVVFLRRPSRYAIARREYWRYLAEPWKLLTFAVATTGMVLIAPYTGDHTWDYFDAAFMSVMTFATASWSVGVLYLLIRRRVPADHAFIAFTLWMFSASWSYDAYILAKSGAYPATWWSNIVLSSVMYLCAGLMWNLQWQRGVGVTFGFLQPGWPQPSEDASFRKLAWFAVPFMILVAGIIAQFLF